MTAAPDEIGFVFRLSLRLGASMPRAKLAAIWCKPLRGVMEGLGRL